jgi:hypothetical protein
MVGVLLTGAGGPVSNRPARVTRTTALEAALAQLDPAVPLPPSSRRCGRPAFGVSTASGPAA